MPSLEYDDERERFKLNLHTPVYNNATPPPQLSTAIINLRGDGYLYVHGTITNEAGPPQDFRVNITDPMPYPKSWVHSLSPQATVVATYSDGTQQSFVISQGLVNPYTGEKLSYIETLTPFTKPTGTRCVLRVDNTDHSLKQYWRQAKVSSGVYLTDLTSNVAGFWQQLGFDKASCTAPTSNVQPNYNQFLNSITNSYQGLNSLIAKTGNLYVKPNQPAELPSNDGSEPLYISADGDTNDSIVADNYDTSSKTSQAYYLIECESSALHTDTINDKSIKKDIVGICSKQYQASDYITAYSDSAVPYIHTGQDVLLNSVKIRITDPDGTVPKSLGGNHCVVLEVLKQPPEPPNK